MDFNIIKYLKIPCFFLLITTSEGVIANEKLALDIRVFISNSFACEHFSGEVGSDLEKKEQDKMNRNIDKYCGGAKKQFEVLQEKYKNNPALLKRIKNNYNDAVDSYMK
ncbi:MAG: hypothetical protein ACEQSK_03930 [Sphingomonadaceae bacterium]